MAMTSDEDDFVFCRQMIDWYWKFGHTRHGRYELKTDDWVNRVYHTRNLHEAIRKSTENPRPTQALWGPSQTGKSTLISSYVDKPDDATGEKSALFWPGGEPTRFVNVPGHEMSEKLVVLNPFSQGSDASGCISRFRLFDSVSDPKHPVSLLLASNVQIMHAIAMGYETECRTDLPNGDVTAFSMASLREKLAEFGESAADSAKAVVERTAVESLHLIAEVLESLCINGSPRYAGLHKNHEAARDELLADPAPSSSQSCLCGSRKICFGTIDSHLASCTHDCPIAVKN